MYDSKYIWILSEESIIDKDSSLAADVEVRRIVEIFYCSVHFLQ